MHGGAYRQTTPQGSADEEARRKLREELFAKEEQAAEERAKQEKRGRGGAFPSVLGCLN